MLGKGQTTRCYDGRGSSICKFAQRVIENAAMPDDVRYPYSEFLAVISHEFRTPLAALKASIELLQREARSLSPQETDTLLGSLHLSVSSLQTLVDNLLETARIESGRFSLSRRVIAFNDVLAESLHIMQPLIDRRQQALTLSVPFFVPPVEGDPVRLVQVIVNLLSNACNYSPIGETIDLRLEVGAAELRLNVEDRGMGVPEDVRSQLFHRFVRRDTGMDDAGVGLGLSVVKAIIEGHGGRVGVESRAGGGSIFWFTLPIVSQPQRIEGVVGS